MLTCLLPDRIFTNFVQSAVVCSFTLLSTNVSISLFEYTLDLTSHNHITVHFIPGQFSKCSINLVRQQCFLLRSIIVVDTFDCTKTEAGWFLSNGYCTRSSDKLTNSLYSSLSKVFSLTISTCGVYLELDKINSRALTCRILWSKIAR